MLDEHGQEFGIHFSQDPPRFGAPGLIDAAMTLPQFEEEFDLPAHASEDESLPRVKRSGGTWSREGPGR